MEDDRDWTDFDATWGIVRIPPASGGGIPYKEGIITRTRERLLDYWIQRGIKENQKKT